MSLCYINLKPSERGWVWQYPYYNIPTTIPLHIMNTWMSISCRLYATNSHVFIICLHYATMEHSQKILIEYFVGSTCIVEGANLQPPTITLPAVNELYHWLQLYTSVLHANTINHILRLCHLICEHNLFLFNKQIFRAMKYWSIWQNLR